MSSRFWLLVSLLGCGLVVSACGGSDGNDDDDDTPPVDATLIWDEDNWDEKDWG